MKVNRLGLVLFISLFLVSITGCGKKELPVVTKVENDILPIEQAINLFLQDKSYGLKLKKVEKLKIEGRNAYVAGSLVDLSNNWEFTLEKSSNGTWSVVAYDVKK
jgi:hypothetical protein